MTAVKSTREALPGDEFLDDLEAYRRERLGGKLLRERTRKNRTLQEMADEKRERYKGGDPNIPRNGDRYVMCPDKGVRRRQAARADARRRRRKRASHVQ